MIDHWLGHHHSHYDSPIARLPTAAKLLSALAIIIGTVVMPLECVGWFIGVPVALLLGFLVARIPLLFVIKRLLLLSPLILGVALVNVLQPTARGSWRGIAVKSAICLATVILVSNTTTFSKILRALRSVCVPPLLITTIALMHRYLFVLADEAERMGRARASRSFTPHRPALWRSLATVLAQLFVRASERAERIYDAMCARGWR